ncbi:hypothetical protein [Streptomyces muensis]|uniref:Uncharacterized protein n=1 Tax=Streptomyces muensis TaxID=1077944 RepID=A0A9X1TJD3_STRM4|nr:hypothetical protein [Streptomyces muensis]MCF1593247.1 hypothetical protein [Streptomyces muensis]
MAREVAQITLKTTDELHAALCAIELRAPAEVRKTARHLFWRICGW